MAALTEKIIWPNDQGYTPCSAEYMAVMNQKDEIRTHSETLDGLTPEDYQLWNVLDNKLMDMQMSGDHLGKSVRF